MVVCLSTSICKIRSDKNSIESIGFYSNKLITAQKQNKTKSKFDPAREYFRPISFYFLYQLNVIRFEAKKIGIEFCISLFYEK
jgi:hypothetical protein